MITRSYTYGSTVRTTDGPTTLIYAHFTRWQAIKLRARLLVRRVRNLWTCWRHQHDDRIIGHWIDDQGTERVCLTCRRCGVVRWSIR